MAGKSATLIIKIIADALGAQKGLKDVEGSLGKVGSAASSMAIPAAAALGGILALGNKASGAASDVEQAFGAVESVFKDTSDATKALARDAAQANGLTTAQYAQMAAVLGAQLKGMGTSADELTGQTDKLIDIGADLAATFGGSTADAVDAVSSLLRGERDPIEKYGVSLKQVDIDAQRAADGMGDATGAAKTQADATATLELLLKKTADAQGAFARETDTAAHAQQVAGAEAENAAAAIGEALLPVTRAAADAFSAMARFAGENKDVVLALGIAVGAAAVAILAINAAMKAWKAIQLATTAAQWLLNAAMSANPIGIVIIAVVALVAAIVLLWQNSETFRNIVTGAFNAVSGAVQTFLSVVTTVFGAVVGIIQTAVAAIGTIIRPIALILSLPFRLALVAITSAIGWIVTNVLPPVVTAVRAIATVVGAVFTTIEGIVRSVSGTIAGIVQAAVAAISAVWKTLSAILAAPFNGLVGIVRSVMGTVKSIISGALDFIKGIWDKINDVANAIDKINPFAVAPPAASARAPRVRGLRSARAGGGGSSGPITVNVYTTGDSIQAEAAVVRALRRQTRLNGGVVPAFGWAG